MSPPAPRLRILHAAMEMTGLAKVGGLADVVDGLSRVFAEAGHEVSVVLPLYGFLRERTRSVAAELEFAWGGETRRLKLWTLDAPGHPAQVLGLEDPLFSDREGIYVDPATGQEAPDAGERYALLGRGVAAWAMRNRPDVVHVHDHHTALVPLWLSPDRASRPGTVLSIHNLGFQGIYPMEAVAPYFGTAWIAPDGPLFFHDRANYLQAGIRTADAVTTVSPGYAREIQETEFGFGLDEALRSRPGGVLGILNGIDTDVWNPETDPHLVARYGSADREAGKRRNKMALLERTGLDPDPERPLAGIISRITTQKGIDLVLDLEDGLKDLDLALVLLGSGEPALEAGLAEMAARHPGRVAYETRFDDPLAHQIQAGADLFLMPSRYEPCGLTQMIALRYGTLPVVRAVGGLADTVHPGPQGNGVTFTEYSSQALEQAIEKALEIYRDPPLRDRLAARGMAQDFSWTPALDPYLKIYRQVTRRER